MTIQKQTSYHINDTKLYTADEVAKLLNVNPSLIRRYCRQGRLGRYMYGRWLISPDELARFKAKPRKVGNPTFGKR
jgi:excisionase family DNA binding protein